MSRSEVFSAKRCYNGVAVLLMCSLVACSEPSQKPDPLEQLLTMEIAIHPLGHPEITQQQIRSIRLWMGPGVGSVNGMLSDNSIYDTRMQNSVRFGVSLTKIESGLAAYAKRMDSNSLTLHPGETRMARLAVSSVSLDQPPTDYWTELREKASGRDLVLIYVDRACSLRGTLAKRAVNLQLTRPGLHWLEYPQTGSDASVKLVDAPQVVIADLLETHISG